MQIREGNWSRQKEQQVQRAWDGNVFGLYREQQEAPTTVLQVLEGLWGSSILGMINTWQVLFQHLVIILLNSPLR